MQSDRRSSLLRRSRGRVLRAIADRLEPVDPVPALFGRRRAPTALPAGLVCAYRRRHADGVRVLVDEACDSGWEVRLWALEGTVPELAPWTVGEGLEPRVTLLNRLVQGLALTGHVVLCDDDIRVRRGGLAAAVHLAARCGLDVSQPAHVRRSYCSHAIGRFVPGAVARLTTFVEVGPCVIVAPDARDRILPLPEIDRMGWGVDVRWSAMRAEGLRLGVLDAVRMEHLEPPAGAYEPDWQLLARELAKLGAASIVEIQNTVAVRWVWRPRSWRPVRRPNGSASFSDRGSLQ